MRASRRLVAAAQEERGQGLVELALALPLLLLILLCLADFGRAFYYTTVLANAAREGAAYLAETPTAASTDVAARVCNETGFVAYSPSATCPGLAVTASAGTDAVVTVTYSFELISSYLVSRVVQIDPLPLRASATFPVLR